MTVAELIAELQECPQKATIVMEDGNGDPYHFCIVDVSGGDMEGANKDVVFLFLHYRATLA